MSSSQSSLSFPNLWAAFGFTDELSVRRIVNCVYEHRGSGLFMNPLSIANESISPQMGIRYLQDPLWKVVYPFLRFDQHKATPISLKLLEVREMKHHRLAELVCDYEGETLVFQDIDYCFNFKQYVVGEKYQFFMGAITTNAAACEQDIWVKTCLKGPIATFNSEDSSGFALQQMKVKLSKGLQMDVFAALLSSSDKAIRAEDIFESYGFLQGKLVNGGNPYDKYEKKPDEMAERWQNIKSWYQEYDEKKCLEWDASSTGS